MRWLYTVASKWLCLLLLFCREGGGITEVLQQNLVWKQGYYAHNTFYVHKKANSLYLNYLSIAPKSF